MSDRKKALTDLLKEVEAGNDAAVQFTCVRMEPWEVWGRAIDAYRGSLDAAKALHEAGLPVSASAVVDMEGDCDIYGGTGDGDWEWLGCSSCQNNPARAWLIAIIKALIAQEPEQ